MAARSNLAKEQGRVHMPTPAPYGLAMTPTSPRRRRYCVLQLERTCLCLCLCRSGVDDKRHASGRPKRGSKNQQRRLQTLMMCGCQLEEEECARVSMSGPMSSSLLLTLSVRRKQCKEFVFLLPAGREFSSVPVATSIERACRELCRRPAGLP